MALFVKINRWIGLSSSSAILPIATSTGTRTCSIGRRTIASNTNTSSTNTSTDSSSTSSNSNSSSSNSSVSSNNHRKLVDLFPNLKTSIQKIQQEVLGYSPPSYKNIRTGYKYCKKQLNGVYLKQYYEDYSIDKVARLAYPGFLTEEEERRKEKLEHLRRNGKGPPKKGSGKRKKKK